MNSEKLYSLCKELKSDFESNGIVDGVNQLTSALQNMVNNPQDSNQQNNLVKRRTNLINSLQKSKFNEFSPAWKQMTHDIGGKDIVGEELLDWIEEIFQKNQITPAAALTELQKIKEQVTVFKTGIDSLITGFDTLELERDELAPAHSEIGFQIPRQFFSNTIDGFAKEISEITFILNTLTEYVNGKKEKFELRSISSSDPLITISTETVMWVLAFAKSVDWLLAKYKTLLEIKTLHKGLKEKGLPDEALKGVENHANDHMKTAIDELIETLAKEFHNGKDGARKNELQNGLRIGFNKLVNRIDKGVNIEIRISKPEVELEEDEEPSEENNKELSLFSQISEISAKIQFQKVEGENIISLPEKAPKQSK